VVNKIYEQKLLDLLAGYLPIDLNSPRAEVTVLERRFDRVLPGGVIVFDDSLESISKAEGS
jgi:hypothetical protein